jgi:DNA-binding response OmpR family regulator
MPGQTILVIDDSPTILKLVELSLTKAGYHVVTAENGEQGLEAAQAHHPDLILLDYLLPDLKGDDVCRAMTSQATLAGIPIIVMSARGEELSECFSVLSNVVNIISKPFAPEALLAVVVHTLQSPAEEPPEAPPKSDTHIDLSTLLADSESQKNAMLDPSLTLDAALAGDLSIISIADVLLLLQDRAYSGVLGLSHGNAQLDFFLRDGKVDFASARGVSEEFLLGRFLVSGGHLEAAQVEAAIAARQAAGSKDLLGTYLCDKGYLTPDGLRKAVTKQTMALVFESLRWGTGRFAFHAHRDLPRPAREAALGLPTDSLILEGLRRVEEWRIIEQEIGNFDLTFVRNEDKLQNFGRGKLLREEVRIVDLVNGKNTVREIVAASRLGSYEVSQILFRLLRGKLIRRRVAPLSV